MFAWPVRSWHCRPQNLLWTAPSTQSFLSSLSNITSSTLHDCSLWISRVNPLHYIWPSFQSTSPPPFSRRHAQRVSISLLFSSLLAITIIPPVACLLCTINPSTSSATTVVRLRSPLIPARRAQAPRCCQDLYPSRPKHQTSNVPARGSPPRHRLAACLSLLSLTAKIFSLRWTMGRSSWHPWWRWWGGPFDTYHKGEEERREVGAKASLCSAGKKTSGFTRLINLVVHSSVRGSEGYDCNSQEEDSDWNTFKKTTVEGALDWAFKRGVFSS